MRGIFGDKTARDTIAPSTRKHGERTANKSPYDTKSDSLSRDDVQVECVSLQHEFDQTKSVYNGADRHALQSEANPLSRKRRSTIGTPKHATPVAKVTDNGATRQTAQSDGAPNFSTICVSRNCVSRNPRGQPFPLRSTDVPPDMILTRSPGRTPQK